MRVSKKTAKVVAFSLWAVMAIFLLSASVAYTQVVTGTLLGTVKDSSGAVIPSAEVEAKNTATGVEHKTTSDSSGNYRIAELQPGTYAVSARFHGFKETLLTGILLEVDVETRIDIAMTPGEVRQTVTVAGAAPVINTENSTVGQVITDNRILDMPLNGRNFMALTVLTGGIDEGNSSTAMTYLNKGYAPAAAGEDATENNYQLDGADNREPFFHDYNYEPPLDAIQEFNIQVGQYTAEFGAGGGAVINVAVKSGTNQIHGTAYEFVRNTDLNARNFFSATVPKYNQNQFGLSVGGPIKKNKVFLFLNYEGYRQLTGSAATAWVPSATDRQGNLTDIETASKVLKNPAGGTFAGDIVGPISPISAALLAYYPMPNFTGSTTYNYYSALTSKLFYDNYLGRFDYVIDSKNSLSAHYGYQKVNTYTPGTYPLVGGQVRPQGFANGQISLTTAFSPTLLNVARFSYNRTYNFTYGQNTGDPLALKMGMTLFGATLPFYAGFPQGVALSTTKMSSISEGQPWQLYANAFQWYDNLAWTRGKHSIKVGFNIEKLQADNQYATQGNGDDTFNGEYTGDGFADMLLVYPSTLFGAITPTAAARFRDMYMQFYGLDEWKVSSKLTLSIGLRYEYYAPPYEKNGLTALFDPSMGNGEGGLLFPEQNKNVTGNASAAAFYTTYRPDLPFGYLDRTTEWTPIKHNFAPRFGFAYRPTDSPKTVVRGGYGWFFSTPAWMNVVQNSTVVPPTTQWPTVVGNTTTPNLNWNGVNGESEQQFFQTTTFGILTSSEPTILTAYTQQWSLGVEHEVKGNIGLTVQYLGSKTTHAIDAWDLNNTTPSTLPLTPRLPYPKWGRIFGFASGSNLNYNSLILQAEKRMGHGFSFVTAYTYARALGGQGGDYASGYIGEVANPNDRELNYGPTADAMRQRFTVSYMYQLPFGPGKAFGGNTSGAVSKIIGGWTFAGVTAADTGYPLMPSIPSSNCNDSVYPNLCFPNRVGNWNLGGNGINSPRFNVNAFTWPSQTTPIVAALGNAAPNLMVNNGLTDFDFSLHKDTAFKERYSVQFRAEFFNGFNHTNPGTPNTSLTSSLFGRTTSAGSPRLVQFGLKFIY